VLFAEYNRIMDAEKMMAMHSSMGASMKANTLKALNLQRENLDAKFVACNGNLKTHVALCSCGRCVVEGIII
jgi:hypothetical protein